MELKDCATGIHTKFRALCLTGYEDVVEYVSSQMTGLRQCRMCTD